MVNSIKLIKNLIRNKHVPCSLLNIEGHTKEAQSTEYVLQVHKTSFKKYMRYTVEIIKDQDNLELWNWSDLGIKLRTTTSNSMTLGKLLEIFHIQSLNCTMGIKRNTPMDNFKHKMRY